MQACGDRSPSQQPFFHFLTKVFQREVCLCLKLGCCFHSVQCWSCHCVTKAMVWFRHHLSNLESRLNGRVIKSQGSEWCNKLNESCKGGVWWADSKQADFYMWFCSQVWWLSSSVELPRHIIHTITCQLNQGVALSRQGCLLPFLQCIAVVVRELLFLQDLCYLAFNMWWFSL